MGTYNRTFLLSDRGPEISVTPNPLGVAHPAARKKSRFPGIESGYLKGSGTCPSLNSAVDLPRHRSFGWTALIRKVSNARGPFSSGTRKRVTSCRSKQKRTARRATQSWEAGGVDGHGVSTTRDPENGGGEQDGCWGQRKRSPH